MKAIKYVRSLFSFLWWAYAVSQQRLASQTAGVTWEAGYQRRLARLEFFRLSSRLCRLDLPPFLLDLALGVLCSAANLAQHAALLHSDESQHTMLRWRRLVERGALVPELAADLDEGVRGADTRDLRGLGHALQATITRAAAFAS
jgi:hypothetical protein